MASKARFGRLPRAAPSLTATIVALAQQYQQVRESNIVDAWKNGGEFEGHHVTDSEIMGWWKARRDELTPGDPKWDYYDNQIREYGFSIANSKMELAYKQKKVSDSGMVKFYHSWAAKLPPNSEAYREREKLAAAYADRAASGAASGRRAAGDKAYAAAITADYKKEYSYDATLAFLTREAHNRGILQGNEDLHNIDPNTADGHAINALWDEIATSPEYATKRKFYADQIRLNGDPHFNGDFSQDAFNGMTRIKQGAVDNRITTARKAGRQTDVKNFTADKGDVANAKIITSGFDETALYEDAHKDWLSVFEDPNATPLEQDRANQAYIGQLNKIKAGLEAGLKPDQVDDRLGAVNNELKTMSGDEHPYLHWGGMFGPLGNDGGKSATETAQGINGIKRDLQNLSLRDANGDPLWVLTKVGSGGPIATTEQNHAQAAWAAVPRDQVDPNAIFVIQNDSGDPRAGQIITAVNPTPINIASDVADPTTGESTVQQSPKPAAYHYTLPDGTVGYKYQDGGGKWLYTPDNPFANATPRMDAKGGSVYIKGNGYQPADPSAAFLPQYYDPNQNVAMSARIAKSGYGMWLITSNPKNSAAYSAKPEDIIASMKLEAGNDPARLAEMIQDADQRRAVYLGNSTEEQNRLRNNAALGIPNPVPLAGSAAATAAGVTPMGQSAEQRAINEILASPTVNSATGFVTRLGGAAGPQMLDPQDADRIERARTMAQSPPSPLALPKTAPTSLGSDLPSQIASTLGGIFSTLIGANLPKPALPGGITGPKPPVYNTAPPPTAPKPVTTAPPKASAPPTTIPTPTGPIVVPPSGYIPAVPTPPPLTPPQEHGQTQY